MNDELQRLMDRVKAQTGYPVSITGDSEMSTHSRMVAATPAQPVHAVFVNPKQERFGDYLVALQCAMLLAKWAEPGKVANFTIRSDKLDYVAEKIAKKVEGKGMDADSSAQYADMVVRSLLQQLNSLPLQMLSIEFLRESCPELSASQGGLSGRQELQDMSKVLAKEIKDFSPAEIYERNVAMNAAFALFWSRLAGDSVCALPYKVMGYAAKGERLLAAYDAIDKSSPARHRAVVDAWSNELKMQYWYEWKARSPS